jgi:hypothetical protein
MDANQLRELATNAQLDHWPPHLGVTTDAEKVEYLAQQLRESIDEAERLAGVDETNTALQEENDFLRSDIEDLKDKLKQIRDLTSVVKGREED